MDPISQVDRLVMILQERMLERSKSHATKRNPRLRGAKPDSADNLKALAAVDAVDDHQLRRALVQNILADQFGSDLINETKFQQVVERVTESLESDEAGAALINRIIAELRSASR